MINSRQRTLFVELAEIPILFRPILKTIPRWSENSLLDSSMGNSPLYTVILKGINHPHQTEADGLGLKNEGCDLCVNKCFSIVIMFVILLILGTGCSRIGSRKNIDQGKTEDHTAQNEKSYPVVQKGAEKLSDAELNYFNEKLFNQDTASVISFNQFLTSIYGSPEQINLFSLFYGNSVLSRNVDEKERAAVIEADQIQVDPGYSLKKISNSDMNDVLEQYLGLSVSETEGMGLEHFIKLSERDAYYYFEDNYTYEPPVVTFLSGECNGDLVSLYYHASDMVLGAGDNDLLACLTLRKVDKGFYFISNQLVPIPMYLETVPKRQIPLKDIEPYTATVLNVEQRTNDCFFCIDKKDLTSVSVCVYQSTNERTYAAVLDNEEEWKAKAFFELPDGSFDTGFGFKGFTDLVGNQGIELSYDDDGEIIRTYFLFSDDGSPIFLAACSGRPSITDMDLDGDNELIAYEDSKPVLYYQHEGATYRIDIEQILYNGDEESIIRFKKLDDNTHAIKFFRTSPDNINEESWNLYFYQNTLWLYDNK